MSEDIPLEDRRFILWNTKRDGQVRYPGDRTDGVIGQVTHENVYLTAYASYPGDELPKDLKLGQCIKSVRYNLSSEHGEYDVYRVK